MNIEEQLKNMLEVQRDLLHQYEDIIKKFETSDIINQNKELNKQLEKNKCELEKLKQEHNKLLNDNQSLRIALKEQIIDEKLNILKVSKNKLDLYFRDAAEVNINRLTQLEQNIKSEIEKLDAIASKELNEDRQELSYELEKISSQLNEKIRLHKEKVGTQYNKMSSDAYESYNELGSKEVDEETIKKRIKHNNIEIKIGLNWINKLGILLILIGVAYALKYSYTSFFTNEMKGIFAFLMGGMLLGIGELFHRRGKSVFAQGLTGGGIGVLYLSIFSCYFFLEIIGLNMALIISIIVTLTALILSLWYNSRTICSLSLIGGFIPFFTYVFKIGLEAEHIYIAMGYLFVLNLLIVLISMNKKWLVVNYISFLLNVPTLVYLVFKCDTVYVGILYSVITFSMYLFITLFYSLRNRISLKTLDTILLALNTSVGCLIIYSLLGKASLAAFNGLLAFVLCCVYFLLGKFVSTRMKEDKYTKALFYLTSFTFAVLMIPFQLGIRWLAMGWLVEAILFIIIGCRNKLKSMEIGGWIVFGLCLTSFYFIDFNYTVFQRDSLTEFFEFKYCSVIIGLIAVLIAYTKEMKSNSFWKYTTRGECINAYKYFTVINLWVFMGYMSHRMYDKFAPQSFMTSFYQLVLFSLATALTAYVISKIKVWYDGFIKFFVISLYSIANIICLVINVTMPLFDQSDEFHKYFSIGVLLVYNILVFLSVKDLLIMYIRHNNTSLEYFPLGMAIYLLGNITAVLVVQFNLAYESLFFSILFMVFAFSFIIFGFIKRYIFIRRLGLGLSIISTAKLFIFDLSFLDTKGKIIAYFAFGIVLLAISFAYQKLAERQMDTRKEISA